MALLYVMLLLGMAVSAGVFGLLLADFTQLRLIEVIQGAAVVAAVLNFVALWKQEKLLPTSREERAAPKPRFSDAWSDLMAGGRAGRLLCAVALGTAGFSMQDILLEPYGGEVLHLGVGATTALTALWALGSLAGFALAARQLKRGGRPCGIAAWGAVLGVFAFAAVVLAEPMGSATLFRVGAVLIGLGAGLFAVGTLTEAMGLAEGGKSGLALGAWGAAAATATGLGVLAGGAIRDGVTALAAAGHLGTGITGPGIGYLTVYHIEIALLFAALVAIGPLVQRTGPARPAKFGLAEFPT